MSVIDLINCSLINSYFLSKTSRFLKIMEIFKNVKTEASKEFEKLLDTQFSKTQSLVEGKIIEGVITKITEKFVFLDCGLKSEPIIDINELKVKKLLNLLSTKFRLIQVHVHSL